MADALEAGGHGHVYTSQDFDALLSCHFNTGHIAHASLTASLNAGKKPLAGTQFMNCKRPAAIIPRRRKEQLLFRSALDRYTPSGVHYVSRLGFDPPGRLLFSIGERGDMKNAPDPGTPLGQLHRINP